MKHTFAIPFVLSLGLWACQNDAEPAGISQVKYEVITTSGKWSGEYIIDTGEKVCACTQAELKSSGWTLEFDVTNKPFELHIDATTERLGSGDPTTPDVTTNIYVNNKLVATNTSNWAPGVASADYTIQ
jgi:hypothetical protein